MKNQKKLCLITTYYGEFPWYFGHFLHSCGFNESVDFLIVTDNLPLQDLPENVKFIDLSLSAFERLASAKMGFKIQIESPYKLCDFKPAYGFIFSDLVKGYDFWGHGDIDVIYGNIRKFMSDEILDCYDVITVTGDYISGAFTLFRNIPKVNSLFMKSKDFKKVFSDSKHYCFDETSGIFLPFFDGIPADQIETEVDSMTHVVVRNNKEGYIKAYFNTHILEGLPGRIKWQEGVLIYKNKIEAMMFHMLLYKHVYKPKRLKKVIPNSYYINANMGLMNNKKEMTAAN